MKNTDTIVEIDVDGPINENLHFAPMQARLRGRITLQRFKNTSACRISDRWPTSIPGQRLSLNTVTGEAELIDLIHEDEAVCEALKTKYRLPPARKSLGKVPSIATWLAHMKMAVDAGLAKVTKGKLPEKIEGHVQLNFYSNTHAAKESQDNQVAAALNRQAEVMSAMLEVLTSLASKSK